MSAVACGACAANERALVLRTVDYLGAEHVEALRAADLLAHVGCSRDGAAPLSGKVLALWPLSEV